MVMVVTGSLPDGLMPSNSMQPYLALVFRPHFARCAILFRNCFKSWNFDKNYDSLATESQQIGQNRAYYIDSRLMSFRLRFVFLQTNALPPNNVRDGCQASALQQL
jgi:hypothetical protein